MRLSARTGEQIFLSGDSSVHSEWRVAGGDDGKEDAAEALSLFL